MTVIISPVPLSLPKLHEPEYHFQLEPLPKLPPVRVKTEVLPKHIADGKDSAEIAETDIVLSSTFAVIQPVFPHVPSALT